MSEINRPLPESYWVEPGRLLAGEYPGHYNPEQARRRLDALLEAGFNTFIDLTRQGEVYPYVDTLKEEAKIYGLDAEAHRFPIGDFGLPTPDLMKVILDRIDLSLRAGRKVYLHCWGGIGRTGTTVGCFLVRHGLEGNEALRQIAQWWQDVPKSRIHPHSPETLEQANFVRDWAKYEEPYGG